MGHMVVKTWNSFSSASSEAWSIKSLDCPNEHCIAALYVLFLLFTSATTIVSILKLRPNKMIQGLSTYSVMHWVILLIVSLKCHKLEFYKFDCLSQPKQKLDADCLSVTDQVARRFKGMSIYIRDYWAQASPENYYCGMLAVSPTLHVHMNMLNHCIKFNILVIIVQFFKKKSMGAGWLYNSLHVIKSKLQQELKIVEGRSLPDATCSRHNSKILKLLMDFGIHLIIPIVLNFTLLTPMLMITINPVSNGSASI